ncbi:MAG: response regulator [Planctomycetota bacterium]
MTDARPRPTILVVDDTIENLRLLATLLDQHGYDTRPVTSGTQALQVATREPPDLILLDVGMPGMDGYEVCRALKSVPGLGDIPVVFVTALSEVGDKVRAFEAGGVDYVTKPFQFPEVLARVKTHLALRAARLEVARSYERVRALEELRDNLVHMVVHDMRSPLTGMIGSISLIEARADGLRTEVPQEIAILKNASSRLLEMTNDLLDVKRLEEHTMPLNRSRLDLVEIVAESRKLIGGWDANRVTSVKADGPVAVDGDRALLRRVVENLLNNAFKHTPPEGAIVVSVTSGGGRVRMTVADEGPGVPVAARTRIFEKFGAMRAREDQEYHSVGLGLAFCKLAIEAHGGSIGVDAREPKGSVFWFELPAAGG